MVLSPATVAVVGTLAGCHANVVSLEQLLQTDEGRAFSTSLTLLQFVFVGIVSLRYLLVVRFGKQQQQFERSDALPVGSAAACTPPTTAAAGRGCVTKRLVPTRIVHIPSVVSVYLRPLQITLRFHCMIAASFWVISFFNNYVLSLGISVPVHTVFRSSSLLFNIALGYVAFRRRYSAAQLVCALVIVAGLIVLSLAPSYRTPAPTAPTLSAESGGAASGQEWVKGLAVLGAVSSITPLLSLLQERAMGAAKAAAASDATSLEETRQGIKEGLPKGEGGDGSDSSFVIAPAPMWAEMTCCAHLLSLPLFASGLPELIATGSALSPSIHLWPIVTNLVTQYACVSSVYMLVAVVGAFTMTFTITMRKFLSLLFSIFYFGHYRALSGLEWVAIMGIAVAGAAYPFLPKAGEGANKPQKKKKKKE